MNKFYFTFILLGVLVASCNDDSDTDCIYIDERLCDPNFDNNILVGTVPFSPDLTGYDQKVFLEDFTGYRCTNCPRATATANNLIAEYGDRVVVAAVHCSNEFAAPTTTDPSEPFYKDFRTESGEIYYIYNAYDIQGLPSGVINRLGIDGASQAVPDLFWADIMAEWMADNNPEIYIEIEHANFNADSSAIDVDVMVKPISLDPSENYYFNMAILENGIDEAQKNASNDIIYDYVHNHVLRGNSHGPWGIIGFPGDVEIGDDEGFHFNFRMDFANEWVPENCEIVVYAAKESTREIVQVEQSHLIE